MSEETDMICAIATPAAMSAYNSQKDEDIPVVYSAISDPVAKQDLQTKMVRLFWKYYIVRCTSGRRTVKIDS